MRRIRYDAMKVAYKALTNTVDVAEEVDQIIAGKILKSAADKYYDAGMEAGMEAGMNALETKFWENIDGLGLKEDRASTLHLIYNKAFQKEIYERYKNNSSQGPGGSATESVHIVFYPEGPPGFNRRKSNLLNRRLFNQTADFLILNRRFFN